MILKRIWRQVQGQTYARIGKNALALLAGQVGARLFNLLLVGQLARLAGTAALGRYLLAMTVEAITLAVIDLGLNPFVTREFARQDVPEQDALWGTVLAIKLLAAAIGCVLLNAFLVPILWSGERGALISIALLALLPDAFVGLVTARVKAQQQMEVSSAIGLGIRLASTLGGLALLWAGWGVGAVLWAYVLSSTGGSLAFICVLRRWQVRAHWAGWHHRAKAVWREALPFALTGIVAILYMRLDLLIISYSKGDLAAGIYGAAYRVWEAIGMIPSSLLDALFPELSRLGGDRDRLSAFYRRGRRLMLGVIILLMLPAWVVAPMLMSLLYGAGTSTPEAIILLRLLMLAFPFPFLYLLAGNALYAVDRQSKVTVAMVVATAFKAAAGLVVIGWWSYWGAACVALAAEVLLWASLQGMARRFVLRPSRTSK
ncbi:MAG: flippase [Anaerolineae bacterium]|nr:flippase [Anaerolineae bacterium]